ncbi:S-adenosylmethionine:tRNA ribosyltransferase-isomerase [Rhizobium sp. Nf11,1]|uniref:S-adenosylmethionine:tRNA ribosyltransferase-isomerase n=1 Tax=Rhizobium sp. Nf11,1 TaxID=3404923 RepID=UPI003D3365E2
MIAADRLDRQSARLFAVGADGTMRDLPRAHLGTLFDPGDLVVANDAATLPASLHGTHLQCGKAIEIRLAGWLSASAPVRFMAIAFGSISSCCAPLLTTACSPAPPQISRDAAIVRMNSAVLCCSIGNQLLYRREPSPSGQ